MIANIFGAAVFLCLRCGYHWQQVKPIKPSLCPYCLSNYWNIPEYTKHTKYTNRAANYLIAKQINRLFPSESKNMNVIAGRLEDLELRMR